MQLRKLGKKGILDNFSDLATGLGVIAIILAVVFLILAEVRSNATVVADSNATAAVNETTQAMADIPGWLPIVVVTVIGVAILGLIRLFRRR